MLSSSASSSSKFSYKDFKLEKAIGCGNFGIVYKALYLVKEERLSSSSSSSSSYSPSSRISNSPSKKKIHKKQHNKKNSKKKKKNNKMNLLLKSYKIMTIIKLLLIRK